MAKTPDFTILASPRVSAAQFAAILRGAGSPAAAEAAAEYSAFVNAGVDPAVGLAVFRKESTFGRFGRAARNRSWGNIRGAGPYPLDDGRFRVYPSWTAGAADAARLLAIYGRNQIRPGTQTSTVQTFPFVWAPSSDGNAPDRYGDQLAGWIADWSHQAGTVVPTPNADPAAFITPSDLADQLAALLHVTRDQALTETQAHQAAKWLSDNGYYVEDEAFADLNGNTLNAWAERHRAGGPLDPIANAIASVGDAIGNAVIHGLILLGLIAIVLLGLYLVATAND